MKNKGQVTIFIIIAILIIAAFVGYFLFKSKISISNIPVSMKPVYTTFLSCLEEQTSTGADILMTHAGYIELPEFKPGSPYMPFSSQLNFVGEQIPYWYYVSGNNFEEEQVPTKSSMENQLEVFINKKIGECSFEEYYDSGYEIYFNSSKANVNIKDNKIDVALEMDLNIRKNEDSVLIKKHHVEVDSKLGKLYSDALKVYNEEQENLFLEDYAIDNLRLYAPVDGVELSCSPKIWDAEKVFNDLQDAIEINTLALKANGDSKDYFSVELPIKEEVRFINSKNWPYNFEVNPSEGNFMISKPIGNQQGLGLLGFCYVPYHFVYNIKYPILVQVYEGEEIFQFPIAIVIQGNNPRKPLEGEAVDYEDTGFCENKNTLIEINTFDSNLNPVPANISYECFGSTCYIGEAKNGVLSSEFPQCVNGYILAKAEGFQDKKYLYSVIDSGQTYLILNKLYNKKIGLKLDGVPYNGRAIINFISEDSTKTIVYPEINSVELSEGDYNISVYIYQDSSLGLDKTNYKQCVDVPMLGIGGALGLTQEKCFDADLPEQFVSSVLIGGGKTVYYITEYELKNLGDLEINAESLPEPKSLEDLQENYILFEVKDLEVSFR